MRVKNNRQEIVIDYIAENYLATQRLRHDVISDNVQINDERLTSNDKRLIPPVFIACTCLPFRNSR